MSMPASARAASRCGHRGGLHNHAVTAGMYSLWLKNDAGTCSALEDRLQ